jgi:hypothetical protein
MIGPLAERYAAQPQPSLTRTPVKILSIRPSPPGERKTIAHVDVELVEGVKLYGLRVSRATDGTFRVFGLSNDHGRTSAFSPAAVDMIARATVEAMTLKGLSQNDYRTAS